MREVETSAITAAAAPPQFSQMFQKLAMAVKTKTYEFFTEDERTDAEGFSLLDSSEDFITDQKVVVLKPDRPLLTSSSPGSPVISPVNDAQVSVKPNNNQRKLSQVRKLDTQMGSSLISSVFATASSFEASYLQLQAAHAPFVEENVKAADRALVSNLQKLSDLKQFYRNYRQSLDFDESDLAIGSCLESRVQENQSKLRALGTVSNRLQAEMDAKDLQVWTLRNKLGEIQKSNSKLSRRLSSSSSSLDVLLSVRVYESLLHDAFKATQRFTKTLIELMEKAGWDLDLAAKSVHPEVDYAKKGHNRYALLSYVCLGMFRGFDGEGFDLNENEESEMSSSESSLRKLMQHVSSNPMELLERDKDCAFSRFCDKKYHELIHPNMASSIFSNMDENEAVLSSWRSLSTFYESYVTMASSIWTLHKLALSFDPAVEIFQVESGVDFSIVFMENVVKRKQDKKFSTNPTRAKVGFTVVPGFKIGCTVIQSQVYLTGCKCK
ncbi:PREDICTED: IRK-interacting protein-like [Camelina sativa]|uniref:IRK-interacting protein-like n=1 Tax=Camelina sativa TaxID=90675 RepID=A0ABM0WCL9_CAMSA|nr:PREDICTED: IRK-interacting protein-like [Camelina sativa]